MTHTLIRRIIVTALAIAALLAFAVTSALTGHPGTAVVCAWLTAGVLFLFTIS